MKRLRNLRTALDDTQQHLADLLGVTQDAVARWEKGQEEPDIQTLRDLAVAYGTSVEDLRGVNPLAADRITTMHCPANQKVSLVDGFWGHIGLRLPTLAKSLWYPISYHTSLLATIELAHAGEEDWMCLPTLRGRLLTFRPSACLQVHLLDDSCDAPKDDWALTWDGYGHPLEVYRGLAQHVTDDPALKETASERFRKMIEELACAADIDDGDIERTTLRTRVHTICGTVFEYQAQKEMLWNLVHDGLEPLSAVVSLPERDEPSYRQYATSRIVLIDAPLLSVMAGAELVRDEGVEI